jgi:2-C-methyl-D-erythritol 4-phosphate cytidylyltransferase
MIFGVILAGGMGSRMNSTIPKQFLKLKNDPIIIITLRKLLEIKEFDQIYIAIHKDWKNYFLEIMHNNVVFDERVRVICGGDTRIDSIYNALHAIEENEETNQDDIIVFHDAVRPFVTRQVILDSIYGAKKYGAVVASVTAVDTMLLSENGKNVDDMPNRQKLYHGQAPDSFNLHLFRDAINRLTEEEKHTITGTSQICMVKGISIYMTPGDPSNIKITTSADLLLAAALYKEI